MDPELPPTEQLRGQLARLDPTLHLCVPYRSLDEHIAVAAPFICIGLERGEQCVYVEGDVSTPVLVPAIRSLGFDAEAVLDSGALRSLQYPEPYIEDGRFDPDRMVEWFGQKDDEARRAGFTGFRYVGEMSWALGPYPGVNRLAEYEAKLNPFLRQRPMAVLCEYDRGRFGSEIIREIIAIHPRVLARGRVCRNPYYVPPEKYLSSDWVASEIDWLLDSINRLDRAEDALGQSEERYRLLAQQLLLAQETERRSLALELHDQLGQLLTGIRIALGGRGGPERLAEATDMVDQAIEEVRSLSLELRPPSLDLLGLPAALRAYLDRQAQRTGLSIRLEVSPMEVRPAPAVETACFRLVQEAVANAARHAGARRVDVELLARDGTLEVTVRDDGKGFDVRAARVRAQAGHSLGMLSMEERAALAGGQLEIDSAPSRGTTLRARFPLSPRFT